MPKMMTFECTRGIAQEEPVEFLSTSLTIDPVTMHQNYTDEFVMSSLVLRLSTQPRLITIWWRILSVGISVLGTGRTNYTYYAISVDGEGGVQKLRRIFTISVKKL